MVAIYLQTGQVLEASRAFIHKIIRGDLAARLWIGFVFLGLIIPVALAIFEQVASLESFWLAFLKPIPGPIGGYFLRSPILGGGV